ncbi:hypothetical protein BD289DRAFT_426626 [Coniella lustricola]|uniref:CN hydrolase domain-containing protein n=1 Tax=Coniella lustricola TaxID=2025994 RepID=A0A2T3AG43_9PEZI|nr:hypothetical protein BD289DRAFT_426626 [Coniella lustricola]
MKIACLQFAPQVGDVDNNLNRADSVLAKASLEELEDLDLLVLPELAFTGYNFKSLNHISPYLEPQGSGISALWARTTALKYNTNVVVGYPEKVDVAPKWPTGPEYYNSTIVINGDGETIANYRKSFLYVIDETWALEGKDGFFADEMPGLGNIAMGICMDLNPYKFEASWHEFEFAFHILAVQANLVIVTMAWVTREDSRHFNCMPEEPDMETLTYWVQRLEPLIRVDGGEEVIVVFANRTGREDDLTYAGTSAVLGIKDEEVKVYGLLGRSVKDILIIDTDRGPLANLVQRAPDLDDTAVHVSAMPRRSRKSAASTPFRPASTSVTEISTQPRSKQRKPSPTPGASTQPGRTKRRSPRIQIPEDYYRRYSPQDSPTDDDPGVESPTCPSPTPLHQRPNIASPDFESRDYIGATSKLQPHILDGRVSVDQPTVTHVSPSSGRLSEKYFWLMSEPPPLRSPMEARFPDIYPPSSPRLAAPIPSSLVNINLPNAGEGNSLLAAGKRGSLHKRLLSRSDSMSQDFEETVPRSDNKSQQTNLPPRPASPKSRNASRSGRPLERHTSDENKPDLNQIDQRLVALARRPGSAMESNHDVNDGPRQGRPRSRRSSLINQFEQVVWDQEARKPSVQSPLSHGSTLHGVNSASAAPMQEIPFTASPSVSTDAISRPQSDIFKNREHNLRQDSRKPALARNDTRGFAPAEDWPSGDKISVVPQANTSGTLVPSQKIEAHIEPDHTRTLVWSELAKMVGEVLHHPNARDESRGRHMSVDRLAATEAPMTRRVSPPESNGVHSPPGSVHRLISQDRDGSQRPIRTILAPDAQNASSVQYNPDDEIVAEIIFHPHNRPGHGRANSQARPPIVQQGYSNSEMLATSPPTVPCKDTVSQANVPHTGRAASLGPLPAANTVSRPSQSPIAETSLNKIQRLSGLKTRPRSVVSSPPHEATSSRRETVTKLYAASPPPRLFEPTTPKAMALKFDLDDLTTSATGSIVDDSVASNAPSVNSAPW